MQETMEGHEENVTYKDGDFVWVKISNCWWPAQVCDVGRVPSNIVKRLKTTVYAFVQFFNEETFHVVKKENEIHPYKGAQKHEFIKSSLEKFRAGKTHMAKFPDDVRHVENLTGGDVFILERDEFKPDIKADLSAIFGSPVKKHNKKLKLKNVEKRRRTHHSSILAHKPFQFLELQKDPMRTEKDTRPLPRINCLYCDFTSPFTKTIVTHLRNMHFQTERSVDWSNPLSRRKYSNNKNPSAKRSRLDFYTNIRSNPLCYRNGVDKTDSDVVQPKLTKPKKKNSKVMKPYGGSKPRKMKGTDSKSNQKNIVKKVEIRENLLADWDDDSNPEQNDVIENNSATEKVMKDAAVENLVKEAEQLLKDNVLNKINDFIVNDQQRNKQTNDKKKSCFDFDEESDLLSGNQVVPGRKIPRVIPTKHEIEDKSVGAKETSSDEKQAETNVGAVSVSDSQELPSQNVGMDANELPEHDTNTTEIDSNKALSNTRKRKSSETFTITEPTKGGKWKTTLINKKTVSCEKTTAVIKHSELSSDSEKSGKSDSIKSDAKSDTERDNKDTSVKSKIKKLKEIKNKQLQMELTDLFKPDDSVKVETRFVVKPKYKPLIIRKSKLTEIYSKSASDGIVNDLQEASSALSTGLADVQTPSNSSSLIDSSNDDQLGKSNKAALEPDIEQEQHSIFVEQVNAESSCEEELVTIEASSVTYEKDEASALYEQQPVASAQNANEDLSICDDEKSAGMGELKSTNQVEIQLSMVEECDGNNEGMDVLVIVNQEDDFVAGTEEVVMESVEKPEALEVIKTTETDRVNEDATIVQNDGTVRRVSLNFYNACHLTDGSDSELSNADSDEIALQPKVHAVSKNLNKKFPQS